MYLEPMSDGVIFAVILLALTIKTGLASSRSVNLPSFIIIFQSFITHLPVSPDPGLAWRASLVPSADFDPEFITDRCNSLTGY